MKRILSFVLALIMTVSLAACSGGTTAAASAKELADRAGVEMPITAGAYAVLYEGGDPRQVLERLMARERRDEPEAELSWI